MQVTEAVARAALDDFRRSIPGVERWKERVVREARSRDLPHVVTIAGRRRYLSSISADTAGMNERGRLDRGADERKAVNTVCQGSAADIVKQAMIYLHSRLSPSPPARVSINTDADAAAAAATTVIAAATAAAATATVTAADFAAAAGCIQDPGAVAAEDAVWATLRREGRCRMVLQIHDELLFEVDEGAVVAAVGVIRKAMEDTGLHHHLLVPLPVKVSVGADWGSLLEVHY